ncbi:hypothetical protein ACJIZ3_009965 [Penstemon smallii]|uniref:Pentatricopeptide repeat-containing protein n=1 Tax=Penstemon smallii TaxID=265156 RepID=A0ABD3TE07_9LAMI
MHINLKAIVSELAKPIQTLSRTQILHGSIIKSPCSHDPFYATKLVRFYAIKKDLLSARKLFDETPKRSTYLWNSIIRAHAQAHKFFSTFVLFKRLLSSETPPDNYTFACILRACSDSFHVKGLRLVHGKIVAFGLGSDFICNSAIVSSYSKLGLDDEASNVFCRIKDPDLVLWNAMISGCGSCGDWKKGLELFRTMQNMGIQPDGYTMVGLITGLDDHNLIKLGEAIHGFCVKCGFVLNDHVGSVLVSMYSRCKSMDLACRVFDSLVNPDLVSWSALITGFSLSKDYQNALVFFTKLLLNGGRPDPILLASVLSASAQLANVGPGCEIHGYTLRNKCNTDIAVSSALIDMYAKCGFLEMGINVFKTMPIKNIVSYNSIISGLGLYGRAPEAFQMFEEILEVGLEPDETTFAGLLCACCHAGLVNDGREYFKRMKDEFGIRAKTEHCVYMVKLLGMDGQLEIAYDFIKSLPEPVDSSVWGALLSCCDSHKNYELSEVIAEHLVGDKSTTNCRYRVMVSNLYAGDERWEDVERLRVNIGGMNEKLPGISWMKV